MKRIPLLLPLSPIAVIGCLVALGGSAHAASGTVTAQFLYFENEGNFCPTTRDCTGAKYFQSQYNTNLPVGDTTVYVRRASDNAIIGQGSSDSSGNFTVSWSTSFWDLSPSISANLIWVGEQKDGRFYVRNSDGTQRVFYTWNLTLNSNTNTNVGSFTWGWSGNAEPYANIYGGAYRMWANSLAQTNRMNAYFSGLTIKPFNGVSCPTSCADGSSNTILLDDNAAFEPQARIMHEMGHIASYRASRDQNFMQPGRCELYSYPYTTCQTGAGWNLTSTEWESAAFEESVATHLGDVGLYYPNATQPHTCLSTSACGTGSFNIETSSGSSCASGQNRIPLNHIRYHWDNYDSVVDYTGETLNRGVWEVVDTLNAFDNGYDNRQKDETFQSDGSIDDYDGRSPEDFRQNWITWGTDSSTELSQNCGSAGD